jgi:hypothetical protein
MLNKNQHHQKQDKLLHKRQEFKIHQVFQRILLFHLLEEFLPVQLLKELPNKKELIYLK